MRPTLLIPFLLAACVEVPDIDTDTADPVTDTDTQTDNIDPIVVDVTATQDGLTLIVDVEFADGWTGTTVIAVGQGSTTDNVPVDVLDGVAEVAIRLEDPCSTLADGTAFLAVTVPHNEPIALELPLYGETTSGTLLDAVGPLTVACGQDPSLTLQVHADGPHRLTGVGHFTRDGGSASVGSWGVWNLVFGQYELTVDAAPYVFAVEVL